MRKSLVLFCLLLSSMCAQAAEVLAVMDQKSCKFIYPKGALFSEEEGSVTVQAVVNASGIVESTKVTASSGSKSLDKATVQTVSECKFKPGTIDGKPATTRVTVAYDWKLSK